MKQLLLATALIALPVSLFAAAEHWLVPPPAALAAADPLGNLAAYEGIVADTRALVSQGDLAGAKARIKDLETLWDDQEPTLRAMDPTSWGNVDDAADAALGALRAGSPDPAKIEAALVALSASLANPAGSAGGSGSVGMIAGIAVTDANGHALPCEAMLGDLRIAMTSGAIAVASQGAATVLQTKATERCNADDDTRANAFSAQALAVVTK